MPKRVGEGETVKAVFHNGEVKRTQIRAAKECYVLADCREREKGREREKE